MASVITRVKKNFSPEENSGSLRRMAEICQLPNQTCDYNSLMRIRNCIEPNYNSKQLDFTDRQTIREAKRPQTCVDVLAEDMPMSCAKKKRNRKRSVLSSSMRPNKDEMQQCHNSALGNLQLTLGKPSGISSFHFLLQCPPPSSSFCCRKAREIL